MEVESLSNMIAQVGTDMPEVDMVMAEGNTCWTLRFDSGTAVSLALREEPSRLELLTEICILPAECPSEVLKTLLMYNFLSGDSGGARMAMCSPDEAVFLVRDLPAPAITPAALPGQIRDLVSVAETWAAFVDRAAGAAAPGLSPQAISTLA